MILIILVVIAAASVILATQLASVQGQQAAEIRAAEEMKARDLAEYCLEVADAYVQDYGNTNTTSDFDALLDPDGTIDHSGAGDDFLPPSTLLGAGVTTSVVSVPASATTSKYKWRAFNIAATGTGGTAGTCLVRFDDNSDDNNTTLPSAATSNTNGVVEGAGVDVPERDRDRTLVISAIGLVPQQATQATAYAKAHARATVKRVRAMPLSNAIGAAIWAGGNVNFGGSICGSVGGLIADSVSGGPCICGVVDAQLVSASQATGAGGCGCPTCPASNAGSSTGPGPRLPDPTINVQPFVSLLKNEGFGKPGAGNNNIAAAAYGAAVVYFRDATTAPAGYQAANTVDVFAWDAGDTDAAATLGLAGGPKSCTNTSAVDPLPSPCNWATLPPTAGSVVCAASESPCWKLVARLGAAPADVGIAAGAQANESDGANAFQPKAGSLPNFKGGTGRDTWATLAGGSSCSTCGGTTTLVTRAAGGSFTVTPSTMANAPHMVAVIDTSSGATVTMSGGTAPGAASTSGARLSVFTTATVAVSGNQTCATCTSESGTCSTQPAITSSTTTKPGSEGYVVRTPTACVDSGLSNIGVMQCPEIDIGNGGCEAGGFMLTRDPGNIDCTLPGTPGTGFCSTSTFCAKNNFTLTGDLIAAGNICMKNNLTVNGGTIQSQENVGWKNNPVAAAQIVAAHDIVGKNNATITFDGTSGAAANQGIVQQQWIDATW